MTSPRVARLDLFGLEAPAPPGGYGTGKILVPARIGTAVRLTTDDGTVGWGESFGPPQAMESLLVEAARGYLGLPLAQRSSHLLGTIDTQYHLAGRGALTAALSGLDIAAWDAWARTLGVPVHTLLGGAGRTSLPAYASSGYVTPDADLGAFTATMQRHRADGFRAVKIKLGLGPDADAERTAAAREAVGPHGHVIVDYNTNNTVATARRSWAAIRDLDPLWVEEPVPWHDRVGWQQLSDDGVPLSGGEALYTRFEFAEPVQSGLFDFVQPDPAKCGGLTEAAAIATLATTANRILTPHCWGSGIALAACVQLLAAQPAAPFGHRDPDLGYLELDQADNPLRGGVLATPIRTTDGRVAVPTAPGLGVEVDEDWITAHAVSHVTVTTDRITREAR